MPNGLATREIREISAFNAWHIASDAMGTQVLAIRITRIGAFPIDVASGRFRATSACRTRPTVDSQWRESRYALAEDFARARSGAKTRTLSWMEAVDGYCLWAPVDTPASFVFAAMKSVSHLRAIVRGQHRSMSPK